jgi:hypothetical protein
MEKLSMEARLVIASNLTVAAFLRDIYISQQGGRSMKSTREDVIDRFKEFSKALGEKKKPAAPKE